MKILVILESKKGLGVVVERELHISGTDELWIIRNGRREMNRILSSFKNMWDQYFHRFLTLNSFLVQVTRLTDMTCVKNGHYSISDIDADMRLDERKGCKCQMHISGVELKLE